MIDKHTPGPWFISPTMQSPDGGFDFGIGAFIDGHPHVIAEVFEVVAHGVSVNARANGHLIAAAPDLLEAVKTVLRYWVPDSTRPRPLLQVVFDIIDAAIAKAEQGSEQ